jgi:hypothetical protein
MRTLEGLRITYHYHCFDTSEDSQRTFTLAEIKAGEDEAHMALIPGFVFVGVTVEDDK